VESEFIFMHERRRFLKIVAAVTSASALARRGAAADAPRKRGLGFSLYGMRSLNVAEAIETCARLGYDCYELPVMHEWPADSAALARDEQQKIRAASAEHGMRLTALMENLPCLGDEAQSRANLERLKRACALALGLAPESPPPGSPAVPLIETILGGKPGEFAAVRTKLIDRLGQWTEVLAAQRVPVAIKAHVSNAVQQPDQLLALLEAVDSPWLHAAYDYSHFELQDLPLAETMEKLLPRATFIHVKDTQHAQGKKAFLLPGEGTTDYDAYFRMLAASAYVGDVVVEVSGQVFGQPGYDPVAAAEKCYSKLAPAMERAGIVRH
jgi:sugar phosphate isomerase/epimerase